MGVCIRFYFWYCIHTFYTDPVVPKEVLSTKMRFEEHKHAPTDASVVVVMKPLRILQYSFDAWLMDLITVVSIGPNRSHSDVSEYVTIMLALDCVTYTKCCGADTTQRAHA